MVVVLTGVAAREQEEKRREKEKRAEDENVRISQVEEAS